jgi:hypothetical protein
MTGRPAAFATSTSRVRSRNDIDAIAKSSSRSLKSILFPQPVLVRSRHGAREHYGVGIVSDSGGNCVSQLSHMGTSALSELS